VETFCLVGLQTNDLRARLPLNHEISANLHVLTPQPVTDNRTRPQTPGRLRGLLIGAVAGGGDNFSRHAH